MSSAVLDASAFLAYLRDEPGADAVADAIAAGAAISTVNLGEVLSRVADRGADPARVARQMTDRGLLDGAIAVELFTSADAVEVGRMRPLTREHGLSLGDRACLALARRLELPAMTADTAWSKLDLKLELRQIR
ncbi:MAG TPA: type II toxin-antitoxin system VapC family toxin [Conexibacter sp.]|nr:type II toxin-antitoxin system VapC family toxin [Conexibacter sp.]